MAQGFKEKREHNGERIGRREKEPNRKFRAENTICKMRFPLGGLYRRPPGAEEEIRELVGIAR